MPLRLTHDAPSSAGQQRECLVFAIISQLCCIYVMVCAARLSRGFRAARPFCTSGKPVHRPMSSKQTAARALEGKHVDGIGSKVVIISGNRGLGLEVVRCWAQACMTHALTKYFCACKSTAGRGPEVWPCVCLVHSPLKLPATACAEQCCSYPRSLHTALHFWSTLCCLVHMLRSGP